MFTASQGAFPSLVAEVIFFKMYFRSTCTGLPPIWTYQRLLEDLFSTHLFNIWGNAQLAT